MKMAGEFEYNEEGDVFYISRNEGNEEVVGSIPIGDVVYDIGASGKVIGLEIDNASEVFGVEPEIINEATNARFSVRVQGGILFICFMINLANKNYEFSYALPRNKIPITA